MENLELNKVLNNILIELSCLKNGQESLLRELSIVKNKITDLESCIKELTQKTKVIQLCEEHEYTNKFNILFEGHALINEKLDVLIDSFNDVTASISATEIASKVNCRDIAIIKEKVGIF